MLTLRSLIFFLFLLLQSCQPSVEQKKTEQKTLKIAFQSNIRSLDPSIGIDYPSIFVTKMLFEGLMIIGPDGTVQPGMAKSYRISNDQCTYTFTLRAARWSNGDEVTAEDFVYSWKKVVDPRKSTLGMENFYIIKNARAIFLGEKPVSSLGVKALDSKTLQITLEHPTPYFLEAVATSSYLPVNAKVDQENLNWTACTGKSFVCNGPYLLKKHRIENELFVIRNPGYWNADAVKMPAIQIDIINEPSTQMNLFEKNELHWLGKPLSQLPLDAMQYLKETGRLKFTKNYGIYWFYVNTESFPFTNKKMRKALAYALNRGQLTQHVLQGNEIPAMGLLPHRLEANDSPLFRDNDQGQAIELFHQGLEELGITKEELPVITLDYPTYPIWHKIAQVVQEQWSTTFGIKVKLEQQDWASYFAKIQKGNFQIGGVAYRCWIRDPIYIMQTFQDKTGGMNVSRWENTHYQALLDATKTELSKKKRAALFQEAEALLMEEMPVIPIYFDTVAYAKNEKLKGVFVSDLYEIDFRWSYFEE